MRNFLKYIIPVLISIFFYSCNERNHSKTLNTTSFSNTKNSDLWRYKFDFDGDEKKDTIFYNYSGGAHCCYQISIYISSKDSIVFVPFEIEGGYILFDLSIPNNFSIYDIDKDSMPEIFINALIHDSNSTGKSKNKVFIDFENSVINPTGYLNVVKYKEFKEEKR